MDLDPEVGSEKALTDRGTTHQSAIGEERNRRETRAVAGIPTSSVAAPEKALQ